MRNMTEGCRRGRVSRPADFHPPIVIPLGLRAAASGGWPRKRPPAGGCEGMKCPKNLSEPGSERILRFAQNDRKPILSF